MKKGFFTGLTFALALSGANAQTAAQSVPGPNGSAVGNPAARTHVKVTNGVALKYTSKLARVVELNFTFGNDHAEGKKVIDASLDRIMKSYAIGGKDAFAIRKIASSDGGAAIGEMVSFTLADLMAGEVIVTNNISYFNQLSTRSLAQANAFETAVKTEGRGVLGFHGSGDGGGGWKFYTEDLHPVDYKGHEERSAGTVYRNEATMRHVVLQNILEKGTTPADVPMGVDPSGNEIIAKGVKSRRMTNEWYKYGRNLTTDNKYRPLVTPLLKYDPRSLGNLPPEYRYKGGNLYTFLLKAGAGKVSYLPAGHDNGELMAAGATFDGGTGDFDRYVAQTLFYLAGYKTEVCMPGTCDSLPIVGADDQLTGETVHTSIAMFDPNRLSFATLFDGKYEAKVLDVNGRVVARKNGVGRVEHAFDQSSLKPGVYFLSVRIGSAPAKVHRYAIPLASR